MKRALALLMRSLLSLAAAALLFPPAQLAAQEIHFPLIQALAWIPPQEDGVLAPGDRSWEFTLSNANVFSFTQDHEAINDLSIVAVNFSHRRALSRSVTLEIGGGVRYHYHGGIDELIQRVDSALGFSDSGRDVFPGKTIHYRYKDRFYHRNNQWAPAPLVIGLAARIRRLGAVDLNGRLGLGVPLAEQPGFASNRPYLLAGLMGEYHRQKVAVAAVLQAVFYDRPGWLAAEDAQRRYFQAEFKATLSSWALGVILRTSPLTFRENGNPGRMMYIAYRFRNGIEVGLMEDLPPMDTVPDVAMYVKLDLHPGHK